MRSNVSSPIQCIDTQPLHVCSHQLSKRRDHLGEVSMSGSLKQTLPNYLISCGSKPRRPNLGSSRSSRLSANTSRSNSTSATSSAASSRCSSTPESESSGPYRKVSRFRTLYKQNYFPFTVDYSNKPQRKLSLAWSEKITDLRLDYFIPELLEGYEDSNKTYHHIIDAALSDILNHAPLSQLAEMFSSIKAPMRKLMNSNNRETILCSLHALQRIICVVQKVRPVSPKLIRSLLIPINAFYMKSKSSVDMDVEQDKELNMLKAVDIMLTHMETSGLNLSLIHI